MHPFKSLFSLFIPTAPLSRLVARYNGYRQQKTSAITAFLYCVGYAVLWTVFCLESPAWQRVREQHNRLFPQISDVRPRLADILRYGVQSLWLIVIRQESAPLFLFLRRGWQKFRQWLSARHQQINSWLHSLPEYVRANQLEHRSEQRLKNLSPTLRRTVFIICSLLAGILAIICISQPFDLFAQFIFVLLLWGIAMVMRRIPGRFAALPL